MADDNDIPGFRKAALLEAAGALGLADDVQALIDRRTANLPWSSDFLAPIVGRINAALARSNT